jgi:hypothetical protein
LKIPPPPPNIGAVVGGRLATGLFSVYNCLIISKKYSEIIFLKSYVILQNIIQNALGLQIREERIEKRRKEGRSRRKERRTGDISRKEEGKERKNERKIEKEAEERREGRENN